MPAFTESPPPTSKNESVPSVPQGPRPGKARGASAASRPDGDRVPGTTRPDSRTCRWPPGSSAERLHRGQELLVRPGHPELVDQKLHRFHGIQLGQRLPQEPQALEFVPLDQELFLPGSGLLDVDRREDALVHEAPVEVNLHVPGALELLE